MLNELFTGLFDTAGTEAIAVSDFLLCIFAALVMGLLISVTFRFRSSSSQGFLSTLAVLPALVTVVIMMVNGNLGAGVAVAGAFSLIRFRSAQGTAMEITAIFLAMGTGLITGMGYIGYSALFTVIMCAFMILYTSAGSGGKNGSKERILRITIPEDLDYAGVFEDVFDEYTKEHSLSSVKTTNMGSMFKLRYNIVIKDDISEKKFIDCLRERNGNLEILMSFAETPSTAEL